jgi:hypothetical protein
MGHQILKTWGCNSYEAQHHIQSLDGPDCEHFIKVCVTILSNQGRLKLAQDILESFPEPILNDVEISKYSVESSFPERLSGPAQDQRVDERNLLLVASVHGRPQGEILQTFHNHFISCTKSHPWFDYGLRTVNLVDWATCHSLTVHTGVAI